MKAMLQLCKTMQGAKKVTFTACHLGKLKLTFTSPNIISTSPKNVLMSRLISQFLFNLDSSKTSLARRASYNRIHQPDSKTHQPRAIGLYPLCTKCTKNCAKLLFFFSNKKSVLHLQSFFWVIRPSDFFWLFSLPSLLGITRFYILFE